MYVQCRAHCKVAAPFRSCTLPVVTTSCGGIPRAHSKTACIFAAPLRLRYSAQLYANSDSLIRLASTTAMRANFRPICSSHGPYVCTTAIQASTICPTSRWTRPLEKVLRATVPPHCPLQTGMFGEGPDQPPQFRRVDHLIDHQHFEQAGTWQRTAARFIRIAIKDRLQVNALQSREQQRDDGDRLDHTKPHSGLIPHLSLPDREKVCIAATSSVKFFNKLYLYQCHTYGTGLYGSILPALVPTKPDKEMREKLGESRDDIGVDGPQERQFLSCS